MKNNSLLFVVLYCLALLPLCGGVAFTTFCRTAHIPRLKLPQLQCQTEATCRQIAIDFAATTPNSCKRGTRFIHCSFFSINMSNGIIYHYYPVVCRQRKSIKYHTSVLSAIMYIIGRRRFLIHSNISAFLFLILEMLPYRWYGSFRYVCTTSLFTFKSYNMLRWTIIFLIVAIICLLYLVLEVLQPVLPEP